MMDDKLVNAEPTGVYYAYELEDKKEIEEEHLRQAGWTYYFTVKPKWKTITPEELEKLLESYPRPLVRDVYAVFEPPLITYNDFELADRWPTSIVFNSMCDSENWRFMENYEEVFASKTGRMFFDEVKFEGYYKNDNH